jgi:O-antigen/teichoic acid export membrane protein
VRAVRERARVLALTDQLVWSASNAVAVLTAARLLTTAEFGVFSAAVILMLVALAASRSFVTEPLLLRYNSPQDLGATALGVRPVVGAALLLAPLLSLVVVALRLVSPDAGLSVIVAAFVACVATLAQDSTRFAAIAAGRPGLAVLADGSWLAAALGALFVSSAWDGSSISVALLFWAAGASTGLIVGLFAMRAIPSLASGWRWLRLNVRFGRTLAADALLGVVTANLSFLLLGVFAGAEALAGVRGAYLLLGPMNSVTEGVYLAAVPALAVRTARKESIAAATVRLAFVLGAAWLSFAFVVTVIPDSVFEALLGDTWAAAESVVPLLLVMSVIGAFGIGALYGIRAWRGSTSLLALRLIALPAYLFLLPVLGWAGGATRYAWGLIIVAAGQLLLNAVFFTRLDRAGSNGRAVR